jgi:hypothetical protein
MAERRMEPIGSQQNALVVRTVPWPRALARRWFNLSTPNVEWNKFLFSAYLAYPGTSAFSSIRSDTANSFKQENASSKA